jgi:hypothetical protein
MEAGVIITVGLLKKPSGETRSSRLSARSFSRKGIQDEGGFEDARDDTSFARKRESRFSSCGLPAVTLSAAEGATSGFSAEASKSREFR